MPIWFGYLTMYLLFIDAITCPLGYELNPFTCTCYGLVDLPQNWYNAKAYCERVPNRKIAVFGSPESVQWFKNLRMTKRGKCKAAIQGYNMCVLGEFSL